MKNCSLYELRERDSFVFDFFHNCDHENLGDLKNSQKFIVGIRKITWLYGTKDQLENAFPSSRRAYVPLLSEKKNASL